MEFKPMPPRPDVSCEFEGKTYSAKYFVSADMVTVASVIYGSKSAFLKAALPEAIAQDLLRELLADAKRDNQL
jgi:hypothetical protein